MLSVFRSSSPKTRWRLGIFLAAVILLMIGAAMGPRPPIDETVRFDLNSVGEDVDQWLAEREGAVSGIVSGAEKEIVWADPATKEKTPLAIVYVHGFSATKWESRPLADKVAAQLGANLFYTRLTGHGQDGEALAEATLNDWVNDMAEAIAVGETIGDRVIVIGMSTGATLATWATSSERLINKVIGLVLISPNYQVQGISVGALNMPWGSFLLPLVFGETRTWEPSNELHGKWWTTSYPSKAIFPMAALLQAVEQMDPDELDVPAYFIYSPDDQVVSAEATGRIIAKWKGPVEELVVTESDDPSNHVIAGDILSPGTTDALADSIAQWAQTLKR